MKKVVLSTFFIFLIALAITTFYSNKELKNKKVIHYYKNNYVYDIIPKNTYILVEKKEQIICIKSPCDPIKIKSYHIKYKKEYKKIIKDILKNKKDVIITPNDISEKENKLLMEIIKE